MKEIIKITKAELTKSENNVLNVNQLSFLLQKTPEAHIYKRPAKGGGQWSYVTGIYVKKVLNLMFGWDWDFEVVEYKYDLEVKQVFVLGKLTCRSNESKVIKMQFGSKDIMFKKSTNIPLDLGNDLKAATTDALKKCASELGIASDVYAPNEFKAIKVVDEVDLLEDLKELLKTANITADEYTDIERIIKDKEILSYSKAIKILKSKANGQ